MSISGIELRSQRIARLIAHDVQVGELRPGDKLASEREMSERFEVSRVTVRRALLQLAEAGLVQSQAGRGTFVASGPVGEAPNELMSFSELGRSRGLEPSAVVLEQGCHPADLEESELFGVAPGARIFRLRRLRMLDGNPICIDTSTLPLARAQAIEETDFTHASLYAVLDAAGARPLRAASELQAVAADPADALHLGVLPYSPLLKTRAVHRDVDGDVMLDGVGLFRTDRYRFRATLERRG
ncbi:MAG: GntR family transcriptional regulator [Cellulomonas sp.]